MDYYPQGFLERFEKLSRDLESFKMLNDNIFRWTFKIEDELMLGGEFHLQEVTSSERIENESMVLFSTISFESVLEHVYLIDSHPFAGDGINIYAVTFESTDVSDIWMLDRNGQLLKLDLDFAGYINGLIEYMSIYNWQYLFVNKEYKNLLDNVILNDMISLGRNLEKIKFRNKFSENVRILNTKKTNHEK